MNNPGDELIVESLCKSYPTSREELVILRDVNLRLARGESLAVTGPSGSGKSTLLHILGTLDKPTSGSVRLMCQDPFQLSDSQQAAFRNQHIGFIFQDHHLLPQLSVLENTLIPAVATGAATQANVERARHLLEAVGLSDRIDHLPSELSGGERQRVAVARSMLLEPTLVLADEPTGNLDPSNAHKIADLLLDLQQSEKTLLIVVTHSTEIAKLMQHQFIIPHNPK